MTTYIIAKKIEISEYLFGFYLDLFFHAVKCRFMRKLTIFHAFLEKKAQSADIRQAAHSAAFEDWSASKPAGLSSETTRAECVPVRFMPKTVDKNIDNRVTWLKGTSLILLYNNRIGKAESVWKRHVSAKVTSGGKCRLGIYVVYLWLPRHYEAPFSIFDLEQFLGLKNDFLAPKRARFWPQLEIFCP